MSEADSVAEAEIAEFLGEPEPATRSKLRRWAVAGGIVAVLVVLLVLWFRSGSDAPAYATTPVERGEMTVLVNATGNLAPTNEVTVGSELSGLVYRVSVDVNDRVVRGQPLAQLDTDKLIDQIRRSEASVAQGRAGVAQAEASVRLSQAALARQEEVYRLSGGKVPSKADLDTARAQYQRDVAALASARAQVVSAQAQLATDQTNLSKATIRSPVNGVILSRQIEPGQTVAASFNAPTLFVIAEDLRQMELEVKVDEADVGQVSEGQPATFTVDAYPGKKFQARIIRVNVGSNTAASGDAASGASSVVSYGAVLAVSNPDLALRPGMTATADILTSRKANVLMVPNGALRFQPRDPEAGQGDGGFRMFPGRGGGGSSQEVGIERGSLRSVYVLGGDGKLTVHPVRVGDSDGTRTIVTDTDLKPGMRVVTGELAPPG